LPTFFGSFASMVNLLSAPCLAAFGGETQDWCSKKAFGGGRGGVLMWESSILS
jgi:hypothetical protein